MASERLRILVTNDDGYQARGIRALAGALAAAGHEVLVVAPLTDQSGVGTARAGWVNRPIATASEDADGVTYIGVDGTPAIAVTMARLGTFGKSPDLVVSGINHGYNFGAILHSGTVGAALTGATQGLSGLAVSIGSEDPQYLDVAAQIAVELVEWLREQPATTVLNVNVPDVAKASLRGVRNARLAPVNMSRLKAGIAPTGEPMMILRDPDPSQDPESDEALLTEGYVTVSSITGVQSLPETTSAEYLADRLS